MALTIRAATADMAARIGEKTDASLPWRVAVAPDGVVGHAYAARWKGRSAYRRSVETSIYLDPARTGRGIGRQLCARCSMPCATSACMPSSPA